MAVSLVSCPSLRNLCRNRQGYAQNANESISCSSLSLRKQKCKFRVCLMVNSVGPKSCGAVASVTSRDNLVSSSRSPPNDYLSGSGTLFNHSRDHSSGVNNFGTQLQELFDEIKKVIMEGNRDEAVDLLRANYEAIKEQTDAGVRGIEEAAILDIVALGYMALGDMKFVRLLLNMLEDIVASLKDDEPLLDSVLIHMASMYSAVGKLEKSMVLYKRVIGIQENEYGESSTFLVLPLLGMAKVLSFIGRATKAVEVYHRVIAILEANKGAESEDLVVALFGLGNLLIKEGKAADAENSFLRILSIYKTLYGENSGKVGLAMCSLAHLKCATGDAQEAINLYKKALKVIKETNYMALDDSIMEKMRIDLAELLHVVGRVKEGRELLEECLLITEKCNGEGHPSSIKHLLNLATSYSQTKNYVEAERLLRTSLEIMMKTTIPDDQSITFPMLNLAATLYHLNQDEEAEELALQAVRIREKTFGRDSLPVGEALDTLVCIQTRQGKPDAELLELLKRVLKIQEREFGYESGEVMQTLKKILFYLDRTGRKDEKFLIESRLSALKIKYKLMIHN